MSYRRFISTALALVLVGSFAAPAGASERSGRDSIVSEARSPELFTDLVAPVAGAASTCAWGCIDDGWVEYTDDDATVRLHVTTTVPTVVRLWVSVSEPVVVDGVPTLPAVDEVDSPSPFEQTDWVFEATGLAPDMSHHVVVEAVAADLGADHATGYFTTHGLSETLPAPEPVPEPEPPASEVTVAFERFHVLDDGDQGIGGKGELSFRWGFDGASTGHLPEQKIDSGETVALPANGSVFHLGPFDELPVISAAAAERDADIFVEFCGAGLSIPAHPVVVDDCDWKINVVHHGPLDLAEIEALPACAAFGLGGAKSADPCLEVTAEDVDDYAHFSVLVRFRVDEV